MTTKTKPVRFLVNLILTRFFGYKIDIVWEPCNFICCFSNNSNRPWWSTMHINLCYRPLSPRVCVLSSSSSNNNLIKIISITHALIKMSSLSLRVVNISTCFGDLDILYVNKLPELKSPCLNFWHFVYEFNFFICLIFICFCIYILTASFDTLQFCFFITGHWL